MDQTFELMSTDPEMGPKLRERGDASALRVPRRRPGREHHAPPSEVTDGQHLRVGVVRRRADWEPDVEMTMDSDVANRYFQGKENVAMAIARRRIKTSGNVKKALALVPITKPVFAMYREMLEREYPHLVGPFGSARRLAVSIAVRGLGRYRIASASGGAETAG